MAKDKDKAQTATPGSLPEPAQPAEVSAEPTVTVEAAAPAEETFERKKARLDREAWERRNTEAVAARDEILKRDAKPQTAAQTSPQGAKGTSQCCS